MEKGNRIRIMANGYDVASIEPYDIRAPHDQDTINAAFIVRCTNNFDAMLEMLYQCRATIPVAERPKGLDAVIKAAQGE